jgi:hypothetical protein
MQGEHVSTMETSNQNKNDFQESEERKAQYHHHPLPASEYSFKSYMSWLCVYTSEATSESSSMVPCVVPTT